MDSNKLQSEFRCARCVLNYPTKSLLIRHMGVTHTLFQACEVELSTQDIHSKPSLVRKPRQLKCTKCPKIYVSRNGLVKHSWKFHGLKGNQIYDHTKNYPCDDCGKIFTRLNSFSHHKVIHKPPQFSCNECDRKFFTKSGVLLHTKSVHLGERVNVSRAITSVLCQQCPMKFVSTEALAGHKRLIHQAKGHKCSHCYKEFATEGRLNSHLLSAHPLFEKPNFECEVCHKVFKDRMSLLNHSPFHGTPTLSCSLCPFKYYTHNHLSRHIKRCHTNVVRFPMPPINNSKKVLSYNCAVCCRPFAHGSDLRRHLTIHYPKSQICPVCQKNINSEIGFEDHMRQKHPETLETFNCGICNKLFLNLERYLIHTRSLGHSLAIERSTKSSNHIWSSPSRKFGCAICARRFHLRCRLRKHFKTHKFIHQ